MKKTFSILLACCMLLTLCGCAAANPGSTTTVTDPPPTTTVTPPTTTQPEPTLLEEMKRLAAEATQMVESGQEYTFPSNWFVDMAFPLGYWEEEYILLQDGCLTIRTDVETVLADMNLNPNADTIRNVKEQLRYKIFLMLLYEEYEHCITERDYNYGADYNRLNFYDLVLFRDYEKAGFATVTDWWKACCEEGYEKSGEIYIINFVYCGFICPDPFYGEYEDMNLVAEIFEELP